MELIIFYTDDRDIYDESKITKELMHELFREFHSGEKRLAVNIRVKGVLIKSILNANHIVSMSLIEEDE